MSCNHCVKWTDWCTLAKGLTGVGVLMAEVSLFTNTVKVNKGAMATAAGILVLAREAGGLKIIGTERHAT